MRYKKYMSYQDRKDLELYIKSGITSPTFAMLALALNIEHSALCKELERGRTETGDYSADLAQQKIEQSVEWVENEMLIACAIKKRERVRNYKPIKDTNRRNELLYFCKQYNSWKMQINRTSDIELKNKLIKRCEMIEQTAIEANPYIAEFIIKNVTQGITYIYMNIPCSPNYFYKARRKFFDLLDKKRN